jgi:hypothetical protein
MGLLVDVALEAVGAGQVAVEGGAYAVFAGAVAASDAPCERGGIFETAPLFVGGGNEIPSLVKLSEGIRGK